MGHRWRDGWAGLLHGAKTEAARQEAKLQLRVRNAKNAYRIRQRSLSYERVRALRQAMGEEKWPIR